MQYFYRGVPGVGNVAVSRKAQAKAETQKISEDDFKAVLFTPERKIPDTGTIEFWERGGIRLVVNLRPEPFSGAALVITAYRIEVTLRSRTPARDRRRG